MDNTLAQNSFADADFSPSVKPSSLENPGGGRLLVVPVFCLLALVAGRFADFTNPAIKWGFVLGVLTSLVGLLRFGLREPQA